jgi:hypothetical protein
MKKGQCVTLIIGFATVLLAAMGIAVRASESSDTDRQKKAPQSGLPRARRASPSLSSVLHEGQSQPVSRQTLAAAGQEIQLTRRISIPYGFSTPVNLSAEGKIIGVAGHGGCTEGQQVTIAVTLTQTSTAALATGETQQVCSGDLQSWDARVMAAADVAFVAEPAQACGIAVTHAGEIATDRFEWCRDVDLVYGAYLPLVVHANQ